MGVKLSILVKNDLKVGSITPPNILTLGNNLIALRKPRDLETTLSLIKIMGLGSISGPIRLLIKKICI